MMTSTRVRGVLAMLYAAVVVSAGATAQTNTSRPPEASAEFLYGVPAGVDLERLLDKPLLVGTTNYVFSDPASGERRLGGYAEVIAVYDLPLKDIVAVSLDFETYPAFVPMILETTIQRRDGQVYRLYYKAGIKFLGIELSYRSIFETIVETLENDAVGVRSRLVDCIDDSEFEHFNSFYFAPVIVQGRTMTFVRYFNRPGVKRPSAGMLQALNLFAPPAARGQVAAIAKEAAMRQKSR